MRRLDPRWPLRVSIPRRGNEDLVEHVGQQIGLRRVSIPRRGNEDQGIDVGAVAQTVLFQSLVGAMRTAEVTAAGLALMRFQSLVGAMRTREEEA